MQWLLWLIVGTFINTFIIITVVDVILMGSLKVRLSKRAKNLSL